MGRLIRFPEESSISILNLDHCTGSLNSILISLLETVSIDLMSGPMESSSIRKKLRFAEKKKAGSLA